MNLQEIGCKKCSICAKCKECKLKNLTEVKGVSVEETIEERTVRGKRQQING